MHCLRGISASLFSPLFCPFLSASDQSYRSYKGASVKGLTAYDYNLRHALFFILLVDL
jgi:hypothetical protein